MKDFAKGFYNGVRWEKCRRDFIAKRIAIDGGLCEKCHKRPGDIVHHVIELNEANIHDDTVALNHRNLQYVCLECHNKIHGRFNAACGRSVIFDENGDVIGTT